jgi:hypothetical protein
VRVLSIGSSVPAVQAMRRKLQQFRRGVQIDLGSDDVYVSHVSRKPGQSSVEVNALPMPQGEPLDGEGMPQVVRSRPNAAFLGLEPGLCKQTVQG